jgi:hypothetical protein
MKDMIDSRRVDQHVQSQKPVGSVPLDITFPIFITVGIFFAISRFNFILQSSPRISGLLWDLEISRCLASCACE